MRRREPELLPEHDFPREEWRLVERRFSTTYLARTEALFAVSNGYLGLRGNFEEGRPAYEHGTLVAGFHETWPIVHPEKAYGLAETGQTIVQVPDAKTIKLYIDDEPLFLPTASLLEYERVLDLRAGTLARCLVWETPSGKRVRVRSERLVSMRHRHLAAFSYEVTVLNADAPVIISSQLLNRQDADAPDERPGEFDPRSTRHFTERVLEPKVCRHRDGHTVLGYRAANSGMTLACGVEHILETDCDYEVTTEASEDYGEVAYIVEAKTGIPVRLTKFASYHSSRSVPPRELADRAERVLTRAKGLGYAELARAQEQFFDEFWDRADVVVECDEPEVQQAVRWCLFQLIQASARAEGTGIPAKGLTGHGYEGHYFWDVEIYMQPFLRYTEPRIVKNLLRFRYSMLDKARRRAVDLNQKGALFPWRTINGDEASAYYQAGTAQYHLNADIAHALKRYVDVTGDTGTLTGYGVEILVETARLWVDLGFHDEDDGAFHLHAVTGPDEYTTVVNDNAFTNLMARLNLRYAASVVNTLRERHPDRYGVLCEDLGLDPGETLAWQRAADAMHVPYDHRRGIHPQDAHFLEHKKWDFAKTPDDHYPLLLHYHPLVIYRHQVIKQADVVLAMFLLGDEFSVGQKRRNFRYYDRLTTADSSLSPPVHCIVAAEVGDEETALQHFRLTLFMDLADVGGNVHHGVHVAATGGVWMDLVHGFGGLRDFDGDITFDPRLPSAWRRLRFPLTIAGQRVEVDITHDEVTFLLRHGDGLSLTLRETPVKLEPGEPVTLPIEDHQPAG